MWEAGSRHRKAGQAKAAHWPGKRLPAAGGGEGRAEGRRTWGLDDPTEGLTWPQGGGAGCQVRGEGQALQGAPHNGPCCRAQVLSHAKSTPRG